MIAIETPSVSVTNPSNAASSVSAPANPLFELLAKPSVQIPRLQALSRRLGVPLPLGVLQMSKMPSADNSGGHPTFYVTLGSHKETMEYLLGLIKLAWKDAGWEMMETGSINDFELYPGFVFAPNIIGWSKIDFFAQPAAKGESGWVDINDGLSIVGQCPTYAALYALALFPCWVNAFANSQSVDGRTITIPAFPAFVRTVQPGPHQQRYVLSFRVNPGAKKILIEDLHTSQVHERGHNIPVAIDQPIV